MPSRVRVRITGIDRERTGKAAVEWVQNRLAYSVRNGYTAVGEKVPTVRGWQALPEAWPHLKKWLRDHYPFANLMIWRERRGDRKEREPKKAKPKKSYGVRVAAAPRRVAPRPEPAPVQVPARDIFGRQVIRWMDQPVRAAAAEQPMWNVGVQGVQFQPAQPLPPVQAFRPDPGLDPLIFDEGF